MKIRSTCDRCPIRRYAERKPDSLIARLWNWHKGWCPGWKAYQRELAQQAGAPSDGSKGGQSG